MTLRTCRRIIMKNILFLLVMIIGIIIGRFSVKTINFKDSLKIEEQQQVNQNSIKRIESDIKQLERIKEEHRG